MCPKDYKYKRNLTHHLKTAHNVNLGQYHGGQYADVSDIGSENEELQKYTL